jgi:hypothetical protein
MTDPLEIAATALTLVCVVLAVKRSLWQFPTGILGTGLGFFVFWNSHFYSSAVLQPIFIAIQVYGWWFWVRGNNSQQGAARSAPRPQPSSSACAHSPPLPWPSLGGLCAWIRGPMPGRPWPTPMRSILVAFHPRAGAA